MQKAKGFYKEGGKTKPIVGASKVTATANPNTENAARKQLLNSREGANKKEQKGLD